MNRTVFQMLVSAVAIASVAVVHAAEEESVPAATHFDSTAWMAKRNDDSDVRRLQAAYSNCLAQVKTPAENVLVPLEHFEDGRVKSQLWAAKAQFFLDTGFVWASGIRVEQFKADGTPDGTLEAESCVVDRKTQSGWVEGRATAKMNGSTVSGVGIYFSFREQFIKIMSQAEIRTKQVKLDMRRLK